MMSKCVLIAAGLVAFLAAAAVPYPLAHVTAPVDIEISSSHMPGESGLRFHGEGNGSYYVVTVFSPNPIHISNGSFRTRGIFDQPTECTLNKICGCFILNGSKYVSRPPTDISLDPERLRYVSIDVGSFNYTYHNPATRNYSGEIMSGRREIRNRTLSPGTWHFILTGALFTSERQPRLHHEVRLNFSHECQDVIVDTVSHGNIYAFSFTDFDSSITVSKECRLELMVNGRATFHVNHSFVYFYAGRDFSDGVLTAEMTLPDGSVRSGHLVMARERAISVDIDDGCFHGVGGSGIYHFNISYLNYRPLLNVEEYWSDSSPVYFLGLDVPLPGR